MSLPSIPLLTKDVDVSNVVIKESGEPLILVEEEKNILVRPAYCKMAFATASTEIFIRVGVAKALMDAARLLPAGMSLVIWDGLRSLALQQEIADRFRQQARGKLTTRGGLDQIVTRYVSPVPTSPDELRLSPPPHSTGGAVDLCLADTDGHPLDLGTHFDDFKRRAWTSFYEYPASSTVTRSTATRRFFRRVLFNVMTKAGFAPYPWEFWHFEIGTKRAVAYHGGRIAEYGPMVPFHGLVKTE